MGPSDDLITLRQIHINGRGGVGGFDALTRRHRERVKIPPEARLPENSGLIIPRSRWALKQARLHSVFPKRPMQASATTSPTDDMRCIVRLHAAARPAVHVE